MNLDQLILKTNVAIAQASNQYLKANLKPALEEWKKQQTSIFKEQSEVYDYFMKTPFILNMKKEIEDLTRENSELRDKINSLERNKTGSPNSNGSNIVLEITEKEDNNVKFVNIANTDIFGGSKHQNGVISDSPDDSDEEDMLTDNVSGSHITSSNEDHDNVASVTSDNEDNSDDDDDDEVTPDNEDDSDDDEDDEVTPDDEDDEVTPDNENNSDDDDEDDEDEVTPDDENNSDDDDDDDEDDEDDYESPIHKNIAHTGGSDKESVNRTTDGEDSSVEVYETSISDALFPDENYYVTNELDGDIYKIGTNGNVGIKIGKYVDKKPTLI